MELGFLPADRFDTASSRIRVYSLLEPLTRLGVRPRIGAQAGLDALFVQKRLDSRIVAQSRQAKQSGTLVLYDCDDLGDALANFASPSLLAEMLSLADVVTTNSEGVREILCRDHGPLPVEILPDTVDYWLREPVKDAPPPAETLRLLWFGNVSNLAMVQRYFAPLRALPSCKLTICTHLGQEGALPEIDPARVELATWTLESFPSLLRSCHLSLLMHDGASVDRAKSNNRMIASIAWGVPAIVSRTPEYERTAILAGVPESVFDGAQDVAAVVEAHRSVDARRRYLERAQEVIWQNHAPSVVANRLIDILSAYAPASARRPLPGLGT